MSDYCYCDHDITDHLDEEGKCLVPGCDCDVFESVDDDEDDSPDDDDDLTETTDY